MSKTPMQRAIEKRIKEEQKAAKQAQLRDRAKSIIAGAEIVSGFRVMDREAEDIMEMIKITSILPLIICRNIYKGHFF